MYSPHVRQSLKKLMENRAKHFHSSRIATITPTSPPKFLIGTSLSVLVRPINAVKQYLPFPRHVAMGFKGKIHGVTGEGLSAFLKPMRIEEDKDTNTKWQREHMLDIGSVHAAKIFTTFKTLPEVQKLKYFGVYHNCYTPVVYALLHHWPDIHDDEKLSENTKKEFEKTINSLLSDNFGIGVINAIKRLFDEGRLNSANAPSSLLPMLLSWEHEQKTPSGQ